jgi:hypothetical protein
LQHSLPSRSPPAACLRSAGSVSRCSDSDQPIARSTGREPYKNNASGKRPLITSARFLTKFLPSSASQYRSAKYRSARFRPARYRPGIEGPRNVRRGKTSQPKTRTNVLNTLFRSAKAVAISPRHEIDQAEVVFVGLDLVERAGPWVAKNPLPGSVRRLGKAIPVSARA